MNNSRKDFKSEIRILLDRYLGDNDYNNRISKFNNNNSALSDAQSMINNFYAQQLNIEYSFGKDRMQIDRAITFAQKNLPKEKYIELLRNLARLCIASGKLSLSAEILNKSLKLAESPKQEAESYLLLSDVYSRRANWNKSIEMLEKANELFGIIDDKKGKSKCENMLGVIFAEKGILTKAQDHFNMCLTYLNREEESELAASVESNLGIVMNILGQHDKAAFYFEKALVYFEKVEDYRRIAELRQNVGMLYFNKREYELAIIEIDKSIEIAINNKLMPVLALSYLSKANILLAMNNNEAALIFANRSLEVCHLIDDKLSIADVYRTKSIIERKIKNYESAENYLQSSLRLNTIKGNCLNSAEAKMELGVLYGEMKKDDKKEKLLHESLNEYAELNHIDQVGKIASMLKQPTA